MSNTTEDTGPGGYSTLFPFFWELARSLPADGRSHWRFRWMHSRRVFDDSGTVVDIEQAEPRGEVTYDGRKLDMCLASGAYVISGLGEDQDDERGAVTGTAADAARLRGVLLGRGDPWARGR